MVGGVDGGDGEECKDWEGERDGELRYLHDGRMLDGGISARCVHHCFLRWGELGAFDNMMSN